MRVFIALVVALVSLLATNSAVLAATASNPNDLVPLTSPELIENRQRDSVRFLRKQENAELDNEERGITDIGNYLTRLVSKSAKQKHYLNLFEQSYDVVAKKGGPNRLKKALEKLRNSGVSEDKLKGLDDAAENYSKEWYRALVNLDPRRV
ncbi:hypothetical protein PC129_g17447 [Phytophthora cactorum]|uniref:RxLR effector protein n=1 Tax=Phytophthora cactorum TaxID=29920 RepID=A0A329RJU6_9STRA|nr:hypothetical protein Pcac1_g7005 [Phytophthora cactorum]KAG2811113.1 hypothetical protein PC112_g15763 [Phytophthora cactorum]KAG2812413.1 hypothetical protein PC111_g14823 [Phytophthora cactorum]KAG2851559.1 hypothetical protein PC113_g15813 [Phytophthora cactorum]KAG2890559.1 hypothetical protein PC114_g17402 [Phytophthora cactorum]